MAEDYLNNPSTLKIDLMLQGIRAEDRGLEEGASGGEGLDLVLASGTLVNVPCGEEFTTRSPYLLKGGGSAWGGYSITDGKGEVAVKLVEKPKFLSGKIESGASLSDIATMHGSYVVITPDPKCEFFGEGVECKYCAGNFDTPSTPDTRGAGGREGAGRSFTVDEVLDAVEAIKKAGASEIIYLSLGFSKEADGGIGFLSPYIEAIKKYFNTLVAVEALPPKRNKWIDETYAVGADSVLYNIEIFDKELFEVICPGREKLIGRKRYLEALKYAAGVFPNGTVGSHLIVGLEPPGSTVLGINHLTAIGVVPILPIYRPSPGRALRIEPLTAEVIIPVYRHLYKTVKDKGINMNWMRDISVITTPIEGRGLVGEGEKGSLLDGFYGSKLGRKTAWGLSTIRRKLRVRGNAGIRGGESKEGKGAKGPSKE